MISKKMEKAINEQINKELYSAYLYLAMAAYAESEGLKGFANWFAVQFGEEQEHAMKFYKYVHEQGGRVELDAIEKPPVKFASMLDCFVQTLKHEQFVTKSINGLADLAIKENDHAMDALRYLCHALGEATGAWSAKDLPPVVRRDDPDDPELDRIDAVTSAALSRLGNPISAFLQDEHGTYTASNGMIKTADTMRRGAAGMGGRGMCTTNPWNPAEDSSAQRAFETNPDDVFIFYPVPPAELSWMDRRQRRRIIEFAYLDSPHVSVDSIMAEADELMVHDPAQAERFFGNRVVQGAGSWLPDGVWESAWAGDEVG